VTEGVQISIITGLGTIAVAAMSGYFSYRAKVSSEATHKAVNSRMDAFLKMAEASFKAQGKLEAREEQQKDLK